MTLYILLKGYNLKGCRVECHFSFMWLCCLSCLLCGCFAGLTKCYSPNTADQFASFLPSHPPRGHCRLDCQRTTCVCLFILCLSVEWPRRLLAEIALQVPLHFGEARVVRWVAACNNRQPTQNCGETESQPETQRNRVTGSISYSDTS